MYLTLFIFLDPCVALRARGEGSGPRPRPASCLLVSYRPLAPEMGKNMGGKVFSPPWQKQSCRIACVELLQDFACTFESFIAATQLRQV